MIAVLLLAAAPVATRTADLAVLDQAVAAFTGARAGTPGGATGPVDPRLRLRPCVQPPALSWHTPRRDTVVVECPDPGGWRLFVPVLAGSSTTASDGGAVLVSRGDAVTIAVSGRGFTVSQSGEALEPGGAGAWIRVRTARTGAEPIRARVVRPGLVAVPLD